MACDLERLLQTHAANDFEELKRRVAEYISNPQHRFENMMVIVEIVNKQNVCSERLCAMCWSDFQPFFDKLSTWLKQGGHLAS